MSPLWREAVKIPHAHFAILDCPVPLASVADLPPTGEVTDACFLQ